MKASRDVQRDKSEVVDGAESVAALQRFPVVEPFDSQTRVRLELDAAFKVGRLAFLNGHFLHFMEGKTRSFHQSVFREPLSDWTAFQVSQFLARHALQQVGIQFDVPFGFGDQFGPCRGRARTVRCPADVLSGVAGEGPVNVQHDKSEIVQHADVGSGAEWAAVVEPLDAHGSVADGLNPAVELGHLPFDQT